MSKTLKELGVAISEVVDGQSVINNRFKWVEFSGEDGVVYRAKVRTSLVWAEIEILSELDVQSNQLSDYWDAIYRYVTEWNIVFYDEEEDQHYSIMPPAIGGPEAFKYVPAQLVFAIMWALQNEAFKKLDPKSMTPAEPTVEP